MLSPSLLLDASLLTSHKAQYYGECGIFFVYDSKAARASVIHNCRTEIAWEWERTRYDRPLLPLDKIIPYLGFWSKTLDVNLFAAKWYELETVLALGARTSVHPASTPNTVILHLSDWWLTSDTRRSILTLFMRMLAVYPCATLDESIDAYPLAAKIKRPVKWFLAGNTVATFPELTVKHGADALHGSTFSYSGFGAEFWGLSDDELAAKLVKEIGP